MWLFAAGVVVQVHMSTLAVFSSGAAVVSQAPNPLALKHWLTETTHFPRMCLFAAGIRRYRLQRRCRPDVHYRRNPLPQLQGHPGEAASLFVIKVFVRLSQDSEVTFWKCPPPPPLKRNASVRVRKRTHGLRSTRVESP